MVTAIPLATASGVANNGGVVIPSRIGPLEGAELWCFPLEVEAGDLLAHRESLSPEELARAERMRPGPRERFVVARGQLRRILATHLGVAPSRVAIRAGHHGKPFVEAGPSFNLSHSGALCVCAVSRAGEVGVDIEILRPVPEAGPIARRWLDPEACAELERAGADRNTVFLRHWTRREAYLKALGVGITDADPPGPPDPARWLVLDLQPAPGYLGALAVARSAPRGGAAGPTARG